MNSLLINYIIVHGIVAVTLFALGLFVLFQDVKSQLYRTFFLFNIAIAWWGFCTVFMELAPNPSVALLWDRTLLSGVAFIPTFILHCTLEYIHKVKDMRYVLRSAYLGSSIFFLLSLTPLMAESVSQKGFIRYLTDPGPAYHIFMIFFPLVMTIAIYFLYQSYLTYKGKLYGKGILYLLIATIIAAIGGSANFLVSYGITIPYLVPFGTYALILYAAVTAYIILRYQWFDIAVVIKKTLVFAGLFGLMFGVFAGVISFISLFVLPVGRVNLYVSTAISIFIIILLHDPFKNFLVNATNKYLFQKRYDPRKVLRDFADETLTILNLDKLCKVTVETLVNNLYPVNCAVLLLSREAIGYEIYDSFGIEDKEKYLDAESALVKSLKSNNLPLLHQSYGKVFQASDDVKKDMDKIDSQLCMPLIIRDELVGILSLGLKKSDQLYNADDVDILMTLVKALSIAISNAKLFMQAAQNEKLAAIGTITSAVNHEVCGPLSLISLQIQMYLSDKKEKTSKSTSDKAEKIMLSTMEEIKKVTDITSKLSSFAKPSNIVTSKPIEAEEVLDEALVLLKHKLKESRVVVKKEIPEGLPKMIADENQLQQIFFNLIRNAAEAIEKDGIIRIIANEESDKIKIKIQDTGSGIPEDKLDKIFEPFYTTKGGIKGSGYGLTVVKELVQRNSGSIRLESETGKGSIFYLEFQKA